MGGEQDTEGQVRAPQRARGVCRTCRKCRVLCQLGLCRGTGLKSLWGSLETLLLNPHSPTEKFPAGLGFLGAAVGLERGIHCSCPGQVLPLSPERCSGLRTHRELQPRQGFLVWFGCWQTKFWGSAFNPVSEHRLTSPFLISPSVQPFPKVSCGFGVSVPLRTEQSPSAGNGGICISH